MTKTCDWGVLDVGSPSSVKVATGCVRRPLKVASYSEFGKEQGASGLIGSIVGEYIYDYLFSIWFMIWAYFKASVEMEHTDWILVHAITTNSRITNITPLVLTFRNRVSCRPSTGATLWYNDGANIGVSEKVGRTRMYFGVKGENVYFVQGNIKTHHQMTNKII